MNEIDVQGLTKEFLGVTAVDNLSFSVPAGEVFGLLGPNGAGKTTTIRMLAALIGITRGTASVAGFRLGEQDDRVRHNVGVLTESPGLYDALSAERNLAFFAGMYAFDNIPDRVEKYLRMLELWERRHELVSTFSKGMRQKLAIARALLHEPRVLFLDEPTSGLDPEMARMVRAFIMELREDGRTIILTTHNLDVAEKLCDRVGVIKTRLLVLDEPKVLRTKLFGRTVVFHLAQPAISFVDDLRQVLGVQNVKDVQNKLVVDVDEPEQVNPIIIRALVNAGADVQFVGEIRRSLEDVYLRIMQVAEGEKHEES